ncbi:hypothetical protein L1887_02720 [Cichorium endivia]|nr:hypothetical protein L1887_02720 [Cichorium endivia]
MDIDSWIIEWPQSDLDMSYYTSGQPPSIGDVRQIDVSRSSGGYQMYSAGPPSVNDLRRIEPSQSEASCNQYEGPDSHEVEQVLSLNPLPSIQWPPPRSGFSAYSLHQQNIQIQHQQQQQQQPVVIVGGPSNSNISRYLGYLPTIHSTQGPSLSLSLWQQHPQNQYEGPDSHEVQQMKQSELMEFNKDEAVRAKSIAQNKLYDQDFPGAKKFILKAQTLYPGLDGISQLLISLDVYIASENKVSGEVDWYGILGLNPNADDGTIRKQYRKLALVLHPDRNMSINTTGAFRLIFEAWSLLSNKTRRAAYNQRRSMKYFQQNGVHTKPLTPKPNNWSTTATAAGATRPPAPPLPPPPRADTFWTICHPCKMHYEYLKVYLNHTLLCPNCHEPFLAKEMPPPVNLSQAVFFICSPPSESN